MVDKERVTMLVGHKVAMGLSSEEAGEEVAEGPFEGPWVFRFVI